MNDSFSINSKNTENTENTKTASKNKTWKSGNSTVDFFIILIMIFIILFLIVPCYFSIHSTIQFFYFSNNYEFGQIGQVSVGSLTECTAEIKLSVSELEDIIGVVDDTITNWNDLFEGHITQWGTDISKWGDKVSNWENKAGNWEKTMKSWDDKWDSWDSGGGW